MDINSLFRYSVVQINTTLKQFGQTNVITSLSLCFTSMLLFLGWILMRYYWNLDIVHVLKYHILLFFLLFTELNPFLSGVTIPTTPGIFFQSFNSFKTSLKYTWAVNVIQIIFLRFKFLVCNNGDSSKMILYGNVCGGNIYDDYLIYANICNRWIWYFLKIK